VIIAFYIAAAVIMAVGSLYFAWRNRDFRKFLAGAFFVSSGILFYLYLADVSVPLLGQLLSRHLWPLHRPFHPLLALFLFWASSGTSPLVRQIASRRIVRYNPSRPDASEHFAPDLPGIVSSTPRIGHLGSRYARSLGQD
jgi:hypothetical protein